MPVSNSFFTLMLAVFLSDCASAYQTSSKMGPFQQSYDVILLIHIDIFKMVARSSCKFTSDFGFTDSTRLGTSKSISTQTVNTGILIHG